MPLPALSQFLAYPPGFQLDAVLHEVMQRLSALREAPGSHIILLDPQQRPTGALSIQPLWHHYHTVDAAGRLSQLEPWVEPIVQVSERQTLEAIWPLPPADTAPPVVVVDDYARYVGVVNPLAVLGWLSGEVLMGTQGPLPRRPRQSDNQSSQEHQSWLLEVSHALKNPMTSLLGLSTLLLDQRVGSLNDRQTRYASLIQQVVRKLIGMVNQLLDWMRLEANQLTFDIETIDVQAFIRRAFAAYLSQLPASQATAPWTDSFSVELPTEPVEVQADPLRLQQSLHWILDYFLLHQAPPGGLEVALWGSWLGITVWSLGPAIESLNALTTLAQASLNDEPATKPGTLESLGVLLTRRFCQLQGGDVTFRVSQAGNRLTLLLPTTAPKKQRAACSDDLQPTMLVLMVCPNPDVVDQVSLQLQGSNYRLALAQSGSEATAMIQRLQPAFVISYAGTFTDDVGPSTARVAAPGRAPLVIHLASETGAEAGNAHGQRVTLQTLRPTLDQLSRAPVAPQAQTTLPGYTILLLPLPPAGAAVPLQAEVTTALRSWLQHYQCRLLQVDDLDQARMLSRVWQPDAILLDTDQPVTPDYWRALAQVPELSQLPLVMLQGDKSLSSGNRYGLRVYACPEVEHQSPQMAALHLMQTIAAALTS